MEDPSTRGYRLLNVIVASAIALAGLLCLLATESVWATKHHLLAGLLTKLSEILIVGGVMGVVFDFLLRRELISHFDSLYQSTSSSINRVLESIEHRQSALNHGLSEAISTIEHRLKMSEDLKNIGLVQVCPKESAFDYSDIILNSKKLTFVFNDGRTWFSQHQPDLAERLLRADAHTTVLLAHPDSPFLDSLAQRVDQSKEELIAKIRESVKNITRMRKDGGELAIWGHFLPTSFSLVMSENIAVLIPYMIARKEDKIPAFVFSSSTQNGFYYAIKRDIDRAISDASKPLYPVGLDIGPPKLG